MVQTKKRHVPINLRQSGDFDAKMLLSTRVRKSPYFHLAKEAGCWCYTVYNRIYHPRAYIPLKDGGLLAEYEYLTKHVSMWDVAVERQIQIPPKNTYFFEGFSYPLGGGGSFKVYH